MVCFNPRSLAQNISQQLTTQINRPRTTKDPSDSSPTPPFLIGARAAPMGPSFPSTRLCALKASRFCHAGGGGATWQAQHHEGKLETFRP